MHFFVETNKSQVAQETLEQQMLNSDYADDDPLAQPQLRRTKRKYSVEDEPSPSMITFVSLNSAIL